MESGCRSSIWKVGVAVVYGKWVSQWYMESGCCSGIWKVGVAVVYGKWVLQ